MPEAVEPPAGQIEITGPVAPGQGDEGPPDTDEGARSAHPGEAGDQIAEQELVAASHASQEALGQPTENPLARAFDVSLFIPEVVEVRMVDASVLSQYEVWIFIASVLSNAVLGFLVAFFQSKNQWSLLATAIVFGILFIASLSTAIWLRHRLRTKSRVIKLQAMQTLGSIE